MKALIEIDIPSDLRVSDAAYLASALELLAHSVNLRGSVQLGDVIPTDGGQLRIVADDNPRVLVVVEGGCVSTVLSTVPLNWCLKDWDSLRSGDYGKDNHDWSPEFCPVDSVVSPSKLQRLLYSGTGRRAPRRPK